MKKINVAELLKDCPKGMELDCTMFDDVTLDRVSIYDNYPIKIKTHEREITLNKYGQYFDPDFAKCTIFPKGKTTWEGFQRPFKNGDIVITTLGNTAIIKESAGVEYFVHCILFDTLLYTDPVRVCVERFATKEEKQELFDAVMDYGYNWNEETKTLEELITPKFKVGDYIRQNKKNIVRLVSEVCDNHYLLDEKDIILPFFAQDYWELVPDKFDKFDVTTLKPLESRVLVRDANETEWDGGIFTRYAYKSFNNCNFVTLGGLRWKQCIPYEGNEHLLGTANDCDEYYKTWEERA